MSVLTRFCVAALVVMLSACASQPKVFTDFDPAQDFSAYKTFSWVSERPMMVQSEYIISPLVEQRLMMAIRTNMEQKGYVFVENIGNADMGIGFTIGARDKMRVTQEPTFMMNSGWVWGRQYWGLTPAFTESTRVYSQGTLAIDVMDMARKAPVWHGVSAKTLSNAEKTASGEFVESAVAVTLASFPSKTATAQSENQ
ncbi:DUF4136 domain-containing protein [Glaciecola siphonariae]|uniref:DUF4136 domain-containing protein n=1 Tax=Glaciecola siphonariae TaxID=521012 RepID=A0ABV9LS18_9ALTE